MKSGQTVTTEPDFTITKMKQDSKINQIKAKGKLDHGNQQQPKQKCPMEDCNHGN